MEGIACLLCFLGLSQRTLRARGWNDPGSTSANNPEAPAIYAGLRYEPHSALRPGFHAEQHDDGVIAAQFILFLS